MTHIAAFDCILQFFEHRNNIEGYIDDKKGSHIEEYSELAVLNNQMYWAFEKKDIKGFVKDTLLKYEMYEVLSEYENLCLDVHYELKKN